MGNMTISIVATKPYPNEQRTINNEHYSKQTQSNPISNAQSQFQTQKQLTQLAGRNIATSAFGLLAMTIRHFQVSLRAECSSAWQSHSRNTYETRYLVC